MALAPFGADPWDEFRGPLQLFDQHFGSGLHVNDLMQPFVGHGRAGYYRPWRHLPGHHSGISKVHLDKDGFSVNLDVRHFSPEEIVVKHIDNQVIVEGKHEETEDEHGYVSRHFVRRYVLPKSVNADALTSHLSSDGVLTVAAPRFPPVEDSKVRTIPIKHTGTPAVHGNQPTQAVEKEKK
ncbi:hypothetical protein J437_LFUL012989 [Ladona fulva]|uniref:SHSP domain-containing protein n=1 Tax=Ladona fulva TaxID=123851 RepID=A0A8K0P6K6_LADFU|nr:hypothetical protein J437_LFUL012989 [Ladona fulva]